MEGGGRSWSAGLFSQEFFLPCATCAPGGGGGRETIVNFYDLDSGAAVCSTCITSNSEDFKGHRFIQVRDCCFSFPVSSGWICMILKLEPNLKHPGVCAADKTIKLPR
jgi:hypothetical protein